MNDSFIKDIVYDLIASKLKIKELEDKLTKLELENKELTDTNISLKSDANKWKTQVVSYIDDYRKLYSYSDVIVDNIEKESDVKEEIVVNDIEDVVENTVEDTKQTRKEYMKEFMRNKRKKEKEELKNIIINKK